MCDNLVIDQSNENLGKFYERNNNNCRLGGKGKILRAY